MSPVEYVISLKDKNFSSGIDQADKKVNGLESSLKKMAGLAAGAFAVNAIKDQIVEITKLGAQFDSYEASLATLLKSESEARRVFAQIKADAKATPFDTESLVLANRALIGAGESAEGARNTVMNLANAIASTGGGADELRRMSANLQQIRSLHRATAADIKQFGYAGLPIYKMLSEATGKSEKEVADMDISYEVLAKTLEHAGKAGGLFAGGLERMSKSTAGQISNLEEAITFLKVDLYNGLKPVIQETLITLANFVQVFVDGIGWANQNKDGLMRVFAPVKKLIDPIVNAISGLVDRFKEANGEGSMLENTFNKIGSVLEFLEPALSAIGNLVGGLIESVGTLVSAFITHIYRFQKPIMGMATAIRSVFISIVDSAKNTLTGVANIIGGILSLNLDMIQKGLKSFGENITKNNPVSIAKRAAEGYAEGWNKGFGEKDFFGDKKKGELSDLSGNSTVGEGAFGAMSPTSDIGAGNANKVSSIKPTSITINIGSLIEDFKIVTENFGMDKNKIASEVSKLLLGAVNDANRLAGI